MKAVVVERLRKAVEQCTVLCQPNLLAPPWPLPDPSLEPQYDVAIATTAAALQDKFHLYFLFDLMPGGDLMDVLVAEAKVIKFPIEEKGVTTQAGLGRSAFKQEWRFLLSPQPGLALLSSLCQLLHPNGVVQPMGMSGLRCGSVTQGSTPARVTFVQLSCR